MPPLDITVGQLIDQVERDLPDADPVARVGEARERARTLGDLGDKLVDHFIQAARRAGASWSQIGDAMGVSKQAAQQRGGGSTGRFARFTERARQVVANAQTEARTHRHPAVEPEHVLAAVLDDTGCLASKIVEAHGADPTTLAAAVRAALPEDGTQDKGHVPFSADSKRLLEATAEAAVDLLNNYVGTEHILLGVLKLPETTAARTLVEAGLDLDRTRDMVAAALMGYQEAGRKATGG